MLRQLPHVRTEENGGLRRFYADEFFECFVWESARGAIVAFQLYYDVARNERALCWSSAHGFFHDGVDADERKPGRAMTPVLGAHAPFNAPWVWREWRQRTAGLPGAMPQFILAHITEFAGQARPLAARRARANVRRPACTDDVGN
jgi:hypothetical protein